MCATLFPDLHVHIVSGEAQNGVGRYHFDSQAIPEGRANDIYQANLVIVNCRPDRG
jgi:hypothetical protein